MVRQRAFNKKLMTEVEHNRTHRYVRWTHYKHQHKLVCVVKGSPAKPRETYV